MVLDQNIDEIFAKRTYPLKNFRFDPKVVWPEEEDQLEDQPTPVTPTSSTPIKPQIADKLAIPLYQRLLENNSFDSTLDE